MVLPSVRLGQCDSIESISVAHRVNPLAEVLDSSAHVAESYSVSQWVTL
jgi:hypothetical protein